MPNQFDVLSLGDASGEYQRRLRLHICDVLRSGSSDLVGLIRKAGGAYPVDVKETVEQLSRAGIIEMHGDMCSLRESEEHSAEALGLPFAAVRGRRHQGDMGLPPPHPADYDWRFTEPSRSKLLESIDSCLGPPGKIGLLGTPTLYLALRRTRHSITLFDRNALILRRLRRLASDSGSLVEADLFHPLPAGYAEYDLIIADPPWYVDYYEAFLLRASQLLRTHGVLFLSVLPWLTRPSAIDDRQEILRLSGMAGLDLVKCADDVLEYDSPLFERRSLEAAGMNINQWRRGDLFTFRLTDQESDSPLAPKELDSDWRWESYEIDSIVVKARVNDSEPCRPFDYELIGSPLATVSRRFPQRDRINLWTSDNRAYSVQGLDLVRRVLSASEGRVPPAAVIDNIAVEQGLTTEESTKFTALLNDFLSPEGFTFSSTRV